MKDIEDLMREEFSGAEQTPPPDVWKGINGRMARRIKARRWSVTIVSVAVLTTAAVWFFGLQNENSKADQVAYVENNETVLTDKTEETVPVIVNDAKAPTEKRETVVTTVETPQRGNLSEKNTAVDNSPRYSSVKEEKSETMVVNESETPLHEDISIPKTTVKKETVEKQEEKDSAEEKSPDSKMLHNDIAIAIPNVITPNGDGMNDCWNIPDLEKYGTVQVQVYTAQSKRVYMSNDYKGDFCGDDLPSGNYFYVFKIPSIKYSRRGVLVISR